MEEPLRGLHLWVLCKTDRQVPCTVHDERNQNCFFCFVKNQMTVKWLLGRDAANINEFGCTEMAATA